MSSHAMDYSPERRTKRIDPARPAVRGRNGVPTKPIDGLVRPSPSAPLARQTASLGSFDFMKLLESGPNGEPLNFAEVLASNPDWADQNADQSTDPEEQGEAQALDSSRNPGGGAEPASADVPLPAGRPALDRSLLDEALKLTGPPAASGCDAALNSQTSLGRLFTAGFSGNFSELMKCPSFNQISKDPSFTSAAFGALLSQKSEDHAMLVNGLGLDAASAPPVGPSLPEAHLQPQSRQLQVSSRKAQEKLASGSIQKLPQHASDASLVEHGAPCGSADQWQGTVAEPSTGLPIEALPIELPRFSEELEAAQQPLPMSHAFIAPAAKSAKPQQQPQLPFPAADTHTSTALLESKVISLPNAGRRSAHAGRLEGPPAKHASIWQEQPHQELAPFRIPAPVTAVGTLMSQQRPVHDVEPPKPLDERVASLDYLLAAASQSGSTPPASLGFSALNNATTLSSGHHPGDRPFGFQSNAVAGLQAVHAGKVPSGGHGFGAHQSASPIHSLAAGPGPFAGHQGLPPLPALSPAKDKHNAFQPSGVGKSELQSPVAAPIDRRAKSASIPSQPQAQLSHLHERTGSAPALHAGQMNGFQPSKQPGSTAILAQAIANGNTAVDQNKSKFLSGLMTGIAPKSAITSSSSSPAAQAVALQLPKPFVKPLPPLPGVPSIQEYQRKLAAPFAPALNAIPRLEVLPLVGTSTPPVSPVRINFASLQTGKPFPNGATPQNPMMAPQFPSTGWQTGIARGPPPQHPLQAVRPLPRLASQPQANGFSNYTTRPLAPLAKGVTAPSASLKSPVSDCTSSGSGDTKVPKRAWEGASALATKRKAVSSGSLDARGSDDGLHDETGDEDGRFLSGPGGSQLDRKALRKAKNRASAAASRARREAYTASLEDEIKRLQKGQAWLKSQVERDSTADEEVTTPSPRTTRPQRQLSL